MHAQLHSGDLVTADALNFGNWNMVDQVSDLTVADNGNAPRLLDSEIVWRLEHGTLYHFRLYLSYSAHATAEFAWSWSASTGLGTVVWSAFTQAYAESASTTLNTGSLTIFRRSQFDTVMRAGGTGTGNFNSAYCEGIARGLGADSVMTLRAGYLNLGGSAILRGGNQTRLLYRKIPVQL